MRRVVMLLLTLVPTFVPQVVDLLGSTVIYVPVVALILSLKPDASMSVGDVTQTAAALVLCLPAVFVGLACALLVNDSMAGFIIVMFAQCFLAFLFQCDEKAPQQKIPGAITVILMNSISLSGYLYAAELGYVPVNELLVYMTEIIASFSIGIVAVVLPALLVFPWTARSAYAALECRVRRQLAERLRHACTLARGGQIEVVCDDAPAPASASSDVQLEEAAKAKAAALEENKSSEAQHLDLRQNIVKLGSFANASVSECRWSFDGSGMKILASYRALWQITRLAISFERVAAGLLGSERTSASWEHMEELMHSVCQVLEAEKVMASDIADCVERANKACASLAASPSPSVSEDSLISIAWLTGTRMVKILEDFPTANEDQEAAAHADWNFEDWKETVIFGRRSAKHSFFRTSRKQTLLERLETCLRDFASTQTFAAALKGALSSTLFVALVFGAGLAPVIGVNAIVNGLHALQSVLRQMYLGACLKRTYDRAVGSVMGFAAACVAWLIACAPTFISTGSFETPALQGWSLMLLSLPFYVYHVLAPDYQRYSIVKVYAIVTITGTFELHGVNEVYQGFWESAGIMTMAIVVGCVFGALFCPIISKVSAKSSLKRLLVRSLHDLLHIVQSGYFRTLDPNAIPEYALDATFWDIWHESRARGTKLLKGAAHESRFDEPTAWYSDALALVTRMESEVWRLMSLVDWTTISEETCRAVSEEVCTNLFFVSATLEKASVCSMFRPPQMSLLAVKQAQLEDGDAGNAERLMTALCSRTVLLGAAKSLQVAFQEFFELNRQNFGQPRYAMVSRLDPEDNDETRLIVKRVSVLNASSHVCLFDLIRQWQGEKNPDALSGLVRSFFQFGGELGEAVLGGARKVNTRGEEVYLHCFNGANALITAFMQQRAGEADAERIRSFMQTIDDAFGKHRDDSAALRIAVGRAVAEHFDETSAPASASSPAPPPESGPADVTLDVINT
ncbi:Hypothetical Protein FCC1311_006962 [Hondaea fermentalgiana]|uniref:Uncharacterized protein n=1 Tax=Hondaea fermentalgiana TaxID=2315210 RepID=A0A2R5G3X6_9STRA|nr:Hypothetical Protein FCC1311_006962 [Hondaea fermentalgiana]|eukprot:GBG24478.1 Hypothetical Protein FCC1311_006962 [Hondaea fermentalgiana]